MVMQRGHVPAMALCGAVALMAVGCSATGHKSLHGRRGEETCEICQGGTVYSYSNEGYSADGYSVEGYSTEPLPMPTPIEGPGHTMPPELKPVPVPPGTVPMVPGDVVPPPPAPSASAWKKTGDWFQTASANLKSKFQR